jgi:hypothetical protein
MESLELKSPHDGSTLTFTITSREPPEADFDIAVRTPYFTGIAGASTYMVGSPETMFRSMATEWKGWKGAKEWRDLEHRCALSASSDLTGHVKVVVTLHDPTHESELKCIVEFEAGQLESIAKSVHTLFRINAP